MKRLVAIAVLLSILAPVSVLAAYGLTNSADLEKDSTQYFSRADTASLSIVGDMTIEAWVKFETVAGAAEMNTIAAKWTTAGNARSWLFGYQNGFEDGSASLLAKFDSVGTGATITSGYVNGWTPSTGVWYHLAVSFDVSASTMLFYIDGVEQTTTYVAQLATSIADGNAATTLGTRGTTANSYFDGRMSLVRIWDDIRTATEISTNKCIVFGTAEANMVGEWSLDNVLTDASGNANTLTNVNTVTFGVDTPAICAVSASSFNPWQMFPF